MSISPYMSVMEAQDYLGSMFGDIYDNWVILTDEVQEKALITATRRIDSLPLVGFAASKDATTHFPSVGETEVPRQIKEACAELAAALASGRDPQLDYEEQAITGHRLGKVGVNRDSNLQLPHIIAGIPSLAAWRLLTPFIRPYQDLTLKRVD